MEKKITSRVTKGVIITAILIALDLILQQRYHPVPEAVRYMPRLLVVFLGVLVSCLVFIRQSPQQSGFGEVFAHGFKTTAVIAFLMAAYTFIAVQFIYPAPGPEEMAAAVKAIEQQGNALQGEATQQAAQAAKNRWIIYVSISIFASLIPGLFGALMGAAAGRKKAVI
ncbi:MAG: DUF4199 domain-containing protein [Chitinophagaceae bacterium]